MLNRDVWSAPVLSRLLPHYVAIDLYRAVLEANASEQSARMIAMRNSTDNANELIDDLTLVYNKNRQANITKELSEIVGGAAALGGQSFHNRQPWGSSAFRREAMLLHIGERQLLLLR